MAIVTKKDAAAALAAKVKEAEAALTEAENLADEYGLEFHFSPSYGMGGYYHGKGKPAPKTEDEDWEPSDSYDSGTDWGWSPSSQSC